MAKSKNNYRPGEKVMYQYPKNHHQNGKWVLATITRFHTPIVGDQDKYHPNFSFIELKIEGKNWKAFSLSQIKKCESRQ